MDNGLKGIRNIAFSHGLILGAILLLLDLISFYIMAYSSSLLLIFLGYLFGFLIIPLVAAIVLIKRLREKIGGYWNLRQATSGIFILFISAHILSSLCSLLFVKFIQPSIAMDAKSNLIKLLTNFMDKIGAEPDKIDELVENIEQQFSSIGQTSFGIIISNLLSSIIILFITALIFAAIFKKEHAVWVNKTL